MKMRICQLFIDHLPFADEPELSCDAVSTLIKVFSYFFWFWVNQVQTENYYFIIFGYAIQLDDHSCNMKSLR